MSRAKAWKLFRGYIGMAMLTRFTDKLYELDRRTKALEQARKSDVHYHAGGPVIGSSATRDVPPSWLRHGGL